MSETGEEMSDAGYIYILINPSMDGLVKIGKTMRDPTGRAKELSGATGVPTPFVLAYDVFFDDCSAAEEFVHALLEQKGYRLSSNREFFNASVGEAIKAVIEAERVLGTSHPSEGDSQLRQKTKTALYGKAGRESFKRAEETYYGYGPTIQDHAEAFRLYKMASRLGSPFAGMMLGIMSTNGEGCKKDIAAAFEFFKQGVGAGDDRCWAEMALLFLEDGHYENANKCWHNYFASEGFRKNWPASFYDRNRSHYVFECYLHLTRHRDELSNSGQVRCLHFPRRSRRNCLLSKKRF